MQLLQASRVPVFNKLTVIVLSVSALLSRLSVDAKDKWKVLLEKGSAAYQVHFILAERAANIATFSYEAWFKEHVAGGEGIWIGDGFTDQYHMKPLDSAKRCTARLATASGTWCIAGRLFW